MAGVADEPASPTLFARLWVLLGPTAPLTPETVAAKLAGLPTPLVRGGARVWSEAVFQVRTIEMGLPWEIASGSDGLAAGLAALPPNHPDVRVVLLLVSAALPPEDDRPRVRTGSALLVDLGPTGPAAARWHLAEPDAGTRSERIRLLHRLAAAEFLLARHHAEVRAYSAELGSDLQFIERTVNKLLRFRVGGQDRNAVIPQLEQNVTEMSTNYAKLSRNAGIFRDAVTERQRLVALLEDSAARLGGTAVPGRTEDVLQPRLDRAREELEACRRQERDLGACLASAQAAIAMQGMNIELLRSGELIELQKHTGELLKKGVSLQAAAVLIEFVVLFAYSLHAWEMLLGESGFHAVPGWLRFLAPLAFSGGMVLSAHSFADWLKEGHFPRWAWTAILGTLMALAGMGFAPALFHPHDSPLILRFGGQEYELRSSGPGGHGGIDVETVKKAQENEAGGEEEQGR